MHVSVIIPAYNAEKHVQKAILSALRDENVGEVIVVDDKSIDGTYGVCNLLQLNFPRVQVIRNESQFKGAGAARNIGIRAAKFPYLGFLDADDIYKPGRFNEAVDIFSNNSDIEGVYQNIEIIFDNFESKKEYIRLRGNGNLIGLNKKVDSIGLFEMLLCGKYGWIHLNGFTLRKEALKKVGLFDESLLLTQDTDFVLRCALLLKLVGSENVNYSVATRVIHGRNVIFNVKKVAYFREILWTKWLKMMLDSRWNRTINFCIVKNYIISKRALINKGKLLRLLFFAFDSVIVFFKKPKLFSKIIQK